MKWPLANTSFVLSIETPLLATGILLHSGTVRTFIVDRKLTYFSRQSRRSDVFHQIDIYVNEALLRSSMSGHVLNVSFANAMMVSKVRIVFTSNCPQWLAIDEIIFIHNNVWRAEWFVDVKFCCWRTQAQRTFVANFEFWILFFGSSLCSFLKTPLLDETKNRQSDISIVDDPH